MRELGEGFHKTSEEDGIHARPKQKKKESQEPVKMEHKNYTEVLIDGVIYTLGGTEEESYLRKVAAYLNEKIGMIKRQEGFNRQNADYQTVTIQLNLADDYFKEQERADSLAEQKAALEKEAYSLKHELITTQMELDKVKRDLERKAEPKQGTRPEPETEPKTEPGQEPKAGARRR